MNGPDKTRRLGRGLEALLATRQAVEAPPPLEDQSALRSLPIAQIRPNPYQPRKEFRPEDLADLEASLRATGLLQPITVRKVVEGSGFELIAGERRLRAATRLGWAEIPAIVKEIDDRTLLTLAMVENLQRADLNPIEEAEGYQRLCEEFGLTQQQVAEVVGKDRTTIANMLRLLGLPASVRRMLHEGQLSAGHGRALLQVPNELAMADLAKEASARGLSVREVERRAREASPKGTGAKPAAPAPPRDDRPAEARRYEDQLRRHFQTDVAIHLTERAKGEIRIAFYDNEDFERLLELLGVRPD
jgi:ParB family chromosome partitioning protein